MDILGLVNNPLSLGIVIVVTLVAMATKEIVMTKDSIFHTQLIKFLNVSITIMTTIFLYLFASTVIAILSMP